jgi:hypothetical protein
MKTATNSRPVSLPRWLRDDLAHAVDTLRSDAAVAGDDARVMLCETTLATLRGGPQILLPGVAALLVRESMNLAEIWADKGNPSRAIRCRDFACSVAPEPNLNDTLRAC